MVLARQYPQQIIEGSISPYEGARKIWREVANELETPSQLLLNFVGAASELEDLPERTLQDGHARTKYKADLEATIVSSAREVLNKTAEPIAAANRSPAAGSR